jgi:flavorubredoxin
MSKRYDRPVEIADHVFWVGFHDQTSNFHCNPYLVVEEDRSVLIDAGSRPDFPVVMMKILQTGVSPEQIVALVYQHPDPDLCGSMSNMVDLCSNPALQILSDPNNNIFLSYYIQSDRRGLLTSIDSQGLAFTFNRRKLAFFKTPYAHSAGSFVTYDPRTRTLFTSDLFGSLSRQWDLYLLLDDKCRVCRDYSHCSIGRDYCPLPDILEFHRKVMPSEKALRHAMGVVKRLDVAVIAPQHGSILTRSEDIDFLIDLLANLTGVGIDAVLPKGPP